MTRINFDDNEFHLTPDNCQNYQIFVEIFWLYLELLHQGTSFRRLTIWQAVYEWIYHFHLMWEDPCVRPETRAVMTLWCGTLDANQTRDDEMGRWIEMLGNMDHDCDGRHRGSRIKRLLVQKLFGALTNRFPPKDKMPAINITSQQLTSLRFSSGSGKDKCWDGDQRRH